MDMGTCCAYFCTGVSAFGILTMLAVGTVLNGGGAHYISEDFAWEGPGDEHHYNPKVAAKACFSAMLIYAAFLLVCGYRVHSMHSKPGQKLADEE